MLGVTMDSLPTGATQSWSIVAAVALSPVFALHSAHLVGRILRRRDRGGPTERTAPEAKEAEPPDRGDGAPPG